MKMGSRTKNVAINATVGLICQIIGLVLSFVCRAVFLDILGSDYVGIGGLFTNILTILSFAELGIGNAIIFSLYKPIAENNIEKIKSLMKLYKTAYIAIGTIIIVVGVGCMPVLKYIINGETNVKENLYLIYALYLLHTASSYFFSYKKSLIIADQKNYIVVLITQIFNVVQISVRTVVLYFTHDYITYLVLQIFFTVLCDVILFTKANRMYPYLKEKAEKLPKAESKGIFKNVRALTMYKFGSVILNGTDNIIVSMMCGVREVGLVSNYNVLINAISTMLYKVLEAFTASVGNLNAVGTDEQKYSVFNKMFFLNSWLCGFITVAFLILVEQFVTLWIGSKHLLDYVTVLALALHFYVNGTHNAAYTYRTTLGYFTNGRYSPVIGAVVNIILSFLMCKMIGLSGIFFATSISRFFIIQAVDIYLIYKKTFKHSMVEYYLKYFGYILLYVFIYFVCKFVVGKIAIGGIIGLLVGAVLVTVIFNSIMVLCFFRTESFKELLLAVKRLKR